MSMITRLLALGAVLVLPATSHAIVIHADNLNQTVERPATGFVDVAYTGTLEYAAGWEAAGGSATSLWTAAGDILDVGSPDFLFGVGGVLFTWRVTSADSLGFYDRNATLTNPARISFAECEIGGSACRSVVLNYSLNVVERVPVPEPTTLSLLGASLLAGFVAARRRRTTSNS